VDQIPVVVNLHDEFVLYIAMLDTAQTMDELCANPVSIAFERNRLPGRVLRVRRAGADAPLPRDMTVAEAGVAPMTTLDFYYEEEPGLPHD